MRSNVLAASLSALTVVAVIGVPILLMDRPAVSQTSAGRDGPPHPLDGSQGKDGTIAEIEAAKRPCLATYERFQRIRQDFSKAHVKQIMGCEGEMLSSSKRAGYTFETYAWHGEKPGTGLIVIFRDRFAKDIAQQGLQ